MENNKFLLYLMGTAIVLVSIFVVYKYYYGNLITKTTYTTLLDTNEEFATGEAYLRSEDYENASAHFQLAMNNAKTPNEQGQIKYKIALSYIESNKPVEAVKLLKEIVRTSNYTDIIKAYSVQQLGHIVISYNTIEIRNEVFKDEPYKSFLKDADDSLARRRLFEYSSSFYPLGIPELRIANWYAYHVLELVKSGKHDKETLQNIEEMKIIIREKLINADKYLASISNDQNAVSYLPEIWYRKGTVLGNLYLSGDTSFGDPEEAFKKALQYSTIIVGMESSAKYSYAIFLAKAYGNKREQDIKALLNDFYVGNKYIKTPTTRMIKGEKDNLLGNKNDIILLSEIDPNFKLFLINLGWEFK